MQTVKLSSEQIAIEATIGLENAIAAIESGNKAAAEADKAVKRGKEYIAAKLKELRDIEVAKLAIGEVVSVSLDGKPLLNVVIGKQNRLDLAKLEAELPSLDGFKRDFPTVSYKRAV